MPDYNNEGKDGCIQGISVAVSGRINPRGIKWVILDQKAERYGTGVRWECWTDVKVHLFAYVGPKAPKKKRGTHVKRGVVFHHAAEVYWSFRDIVCQQEKGYTIHHTFIFYCYKGFPEIWWRCGGRTTKWVWPWQPIWSASRSSFYRWKCFVPPAGEKYCDTWGPILDGYGADPPCEEGCPFRPTEEYELIRIIVELHSFFGKPGPSEFTYCLYNADNNCKPMGSPLRQHTLYPGDWPRNTYKTFDFDIEPIILLADHSYFQSVLNLQDDTGIYLQLGNSESCACFPGGWTRKFPGPYGYEWRHWVWLNRTLRYTHYGP